MTYLVALSGGADSVALLLKMLEEGKAGAAAHCNFHLRGAESDRDELFVRRLCEERGMRLFVRHFDTVAEASLTGESIEMAARRLRYAWFAELCKKEGFDAVAVAHHRDDNAETILLNLVRGTGLRGLTGMKRQRDGIVRPLLGWSRQQILAYLQEKGQPFVTDSTNADTHYHRNCVRHEVLPLLQKLNPQVVTALNDMAARLQDVEKIFDLALSQLRKEMISELQDGFSVDAKKLEKSPAPLTLLHEWTSGCGFPPEQLSEALSLRTGALIEGEGWLLTRTATAIEVRRKPQKVENVVVPQEDCIFFSTEKWEMGVRHLSRRELDGISKKKNVCTLDAAAVSGRLRLRSVREGDRFEPFGMKGSQLVSDFLTNRHRSRIDKMAALVIEDDCGIVWLVNERPARRTAITAGTRQVIVIYTREK